MKLIIEDVAMKNQTNRQTLFFSGFTDPKLRGWCSGSSADRSWCQGQAAPRASFTAPWKPWAQGCSSLGFPCKNTDKLQQGVSNHQGFSFFHFCLHFSLLLAQWRMNSVSTVEGQQLRHEHCSIPCGMTKTSGREEQFSSGCLCVFSSPIHAFPRFPVTQHWPHFQWSHGNHGNDWWQSPANKGKRPLLHLKIFILKIFY